MYYFDNGNLWRVEKKKSGFEYNPIESSKCIAPTLEAIDPRELNPWGIDWLRSLNFRESKKFIKKAEATPKIGNLVKIRGLEGTIYEWIAEKASECWDSIYLKLVEGESVLASLTNEEKESFGLPSKEKIYQLSKGTDLVVHDPDYIEYDPSNLATYPTESNGPDIQTMVIEVPGFTPLEDPRLIKTSGGTITLEILMLSLKVRLKRDITKPLPDYGSWKSGTNLDWHLMRDDNGKIIQKGGIIRLLVNLYHPISKKGISPVSLEGLEINNLFEVSWVVENSIQTDKKITKKEGPKYDENLFIIKEGLPWKIGAKDAILRKD